MKKPIILTMLFSLLITPLLSVSEVTATTLDRSSQPHPSEVEHSKNPEISVEPDNLTEPLAESEPTQKEHTDNPYSAELSVDQALLRSDITTQANEKLQELKNKLDLSKGIGIYIGDQLTISLEGHIHLDYTLPDQSVVTYDGILSFEKPTYQNFPSTKTELTEQSFIVTREREGLDKTFYETISARWHFIGKKTINGENPTEITLDQVNNTWEYPLSISLILKVDVPPLIVDAPRGTSKENPILIEKNSNVSTNPTDYFRVLSSGYEATIEWHVKPDFTKENEFTAELGIRDKFDQYWTVNGQSSVIIYFKVVDDMPEYLTSLTPEISYVDIQLENGSQGLHVTNKLDADDNTKINSIPAQLNYMRFSFPGEFSLLNEAISMEAIIKSTNQRIPIGNDEYSIVTAGNSFSLTNLSKRIEMFYAQEEIIIHYDLKKLTKLTREAYCTFETNYSPQNSETNTAKTLAKIQESEGELTLTVPENVSFGAIEIGQKSQTTLSSIDPESLYITDNRETKTALKLLIDLSSPLKSSSHNGELLGGLSLKEFTPNTGKQYLFYEGMIAGNQDNTFDLTSQLTESLELNLSGSEQLGNYEGIIKWTLISAEP